MGGTFGPASAARRSGWTSRSWRCVVTTLDLDTGLRDFPTLKVIKNYRGINAEQQLEFGVYAEVVEPGEVSVGDPSNPSERSLHSRRGRRSRPATACVVTGGPVLVFARTCAESRWRNKVGRSDDLDAFEPGGPEHPDDRGRVRPHQLVGSRFASEPS